MKKLLEGMEKFHREVFPTQKALFEDLADGQCPRALFITCSDSRIVPDLITQAKPGDLFICRNAGNIVPPYGEMIGGVSATIEYALLALNIPNIIVCGHTDCGAMKGILHPENLVDMPTVATWLKVAEPARRVVRDHYGTLEEEEQLAILTEENVVAQIANLTTHPSVASRLAAGKLQIYGWMYNIRTGEVRAYDATKGEFVPGDTYEMPTATPRARLRHVTPASDHTVGVVTEVGV